MKKRFFHFSHIIIKFFIQNVNEFHKKKNHLKIFFDSQFFVQIFDFIVTFFFSIFEMQFFFSLFFRNQIDFSIFFRFFEIRRCVQFSL